VEKNGMEGFFYAQIEGNIDKKIHKVSAGGYRPDRNGQGPVEALLRP